MPRATSSGKRANAERGARAPRGSRDQRPDRPLQKAIPGRAFKVPSEPVSQSGQWLLPIPLLGLLLLVIAAGWMLLGHRSERIALAGAGGQAAVGGWYTGLLSSAAKPKFTWRGLAEVVAITGAVVASIVAVQAFVIKPVVIPSGSMLPTLAVGQTVIMERITQRYDDPDRGDIVVFKPPAGATDNHCGVAHPADEACPKPTGGQADNAFIKRIVAEPGDRLKIVQGRVYIDGKLQREPHIRAAVDCNTCNLPHEITIPPGHVFVMGDNRGHSIDSRTWGPVRRDKIIGRAVLSFWPPGRFLRPL
ncbi:MAG: signal peptidase I [Actinobacteria bacterium]|nr:signal peptidase I [Actinomycetota bacterium]